MLCLGLPLVGYGAEVRIASVFGDGMVLQREKPIRIWGESAPNARIAVEFAGLTSSGVADGEGRWRVELPAQTASCTGRQLTVSCREADGGPVSFATLSDVLVGEVWFCAGQSNVNVPIWCELPRYRDGQGGLVLQMTRRPLVRIVKTPLAWCRMPKLDVKAKWKPFVPESFPFPGRFEEMPSALGCYFALELSNALGDVPIAVICASQGGTYIQSWTPGHAPRQPLTGACHYHEPSSLWNGMVAAYAPMAVRGVVWYQGESNLADAGRYCELMHLFYDRWAKAFENAELSLRFVQIAPWGDPKVPQLQEAQARFAAEEPRSKMAVICDIGNLYDIHPNDKRTPARRLAALALRYDYGWSELAADSPTVTEWTVRDGAFELSFAHANGWYVYRADRSLSTGFEIAGEDGKFVPAEIVNFSNRNAEGKSFKPDGRIDGRRLVVRAKEVATPKRLRYLHVKPWQGTVFNESGLPLGPFHIDD